MERGIAWYWNRLRAMSADEIAARTARAMKKKMWRRRAVWIASSPRGRGRGDWRLPELRDGDESAVREVIREADRYMRGEYRMLNVPYRESPMDWHRDPQTGLRAPLRFGPDMDYRDSALAGNVKNIWEKNRHHHLTMLALACAVTGREHYAERTADALCDWVEKNPFPQGINWNSGLEAGIRLISWMWIDRLLRETEAHRRLFGENGALWPAIYWHQRFIAEHYSLGSSSNNHLVGEMSGLYQAALVWPFFEESERWREFAKQTLEREIFLQTFPGGVNREQAFSYHIFALELFLLAALEGDRLDDGYSRRYRQRLVRMLEVIPTMTDAGGNLPRYGDEDHGMALQLRPLASSRTGWLYALGRQWLGAEVPLTGDDGGALASRIVGSGVRERPREAEAAGLGGRGGYGGHDGQRDRLGGRGGHDGQRDRLGGRGGFDGRGRFDGTEGPPGFADSGNYVLASRRNEKDEIFCLADAAPLGYLSIAGHGHADALSFALHVGGVPVIVDPGTYTYHFDPWGRAYFRGTKAHNTVTVDGRNQSVEAGPFLWHGKAETAVIDWAPRPDGGLLTAQHDGYARLPGRVMHRRQWVLQDRRLLVLDELAGSGRHEVEYRLHFAPHCRAVLDAGVCRVTWPQGKLTVRLDPRLAWRLIRGEPDGGWYSPGFNLKEPAFTLAGSLISNFPLTMSHMLEVSDEN